VQQTIPKHLTVEQQEAFLAQVPTASAATPEMTEYVAHYCGLDCFAKWVDRDVAASGRRTGRSGATPIQKKSLNPPP